MSRVFDKGAKKNDPTRIETGPRPLWKVVEGCGEKGNQEEEEEEEGWT